MQTTDTLAQALIELPVFASLSTEDAAELARGCFVVDLGHGDLLFAEGEPPDHVYVLLAGQAQISCRTPGGDEVVVGRAHSGAVLGEMGLLESALRSASVRASGPVQALQIPGARFGALVNQAHPAAWTLLRAIREQLVQRLRSVDERVDAVLEPPTSERDSEVLRQGLDGIWTTLRSGRL